MLPQDHRLRGRLGAASLILGVALASTGLGPVLAADASEMSETETSESEVDAHPLGSSNQAAMAAVDEDRRVEQRIERRLAWDAEFAPYDLEVKVNNGIVNLSGSVSTMAESHRARRLANETEGVAGVVNAIYVDPALVAFENRSLERPDDETLTKRLQVRFAHDPDLANETIKAEVDEGIVQLHGTVKDYSSVMRAKRLAESLFGVKRVSSELDVTTP